MKPRWKFVEDVGTAGSAWTWTLAPLNDVIESRSEPFGEYGEMIYNAIENGFHPSREHWIVVADGGVTHYHDNSPLPRSSDDSAPPMRPLAQPKPPRSRRQLKRTGQ